MPLNLSIIRRGTPPFEQRVKSPGGRKGRLPGDFSADEQGALGVGVDGAIQPAAAIMVRSRSSPMTIKLNGDPHEVPGPISVSALLEQLEIDARRVAVELNLTVVKKAAYDASLINDGDEVEIVNFVGGG